MNTAQTFLVDEKLKALVYVQKIDSKLDESRFIKGQLPEEVNELEDQVSGLNLRLSRIEEEINGIKEYVNDTTDKIEASRVLIDKYEKQAKNVRNSREYNAINHEMEVQQVEIKILERRIKNANDDFEQKVIQINQIRQDIENKQSILDQKREELKEVIASTEKEENRYSKLSEQAKSKLDERLLYTYNKIRNTYKNGVAVAVIERDACGGCFQLIPPQKQAEIALKKRLILCESCGRILVDKETMDSVTI